MSEWAIVGVLATLVTLFIALATPMIKLNTAITKLTAVAERLEKEFSDFTEKNSASHRRIWEHNEEQDGKIADHEKRIYVLENK